MCGIAGVIRFDQDAFDLAILQNLAQALQHRGPDDRGFLSWSGAAAVQVSQDPWAIQRGWVGLVHCRLSILDLSAAGWQPMGTPDGRYYIVLNGEIYNYLELRAELQALGYTFRSHSDTEVLLTAYAHWGASGPVSPCRHVRFLYSGYPSTSALSGPRLFWHQTVVLHLLASRVCLCL